METVEIADIGELESLRVGWKALLERQSDDSPYLTPEFMLPWMRHAARPNTCRALAAIEGGRLEGLVLLVERVIRRFGVRFVSWTFPTRGTTPPFDIIVSERHEEAMSGFCEWWFRQKDWDLLELMNVRSESPTIDMLRRSVERAGNQLFIETNLRTYMVSVKSSWDEFLRSKSRNLRRNLTRGWRRCREAGEVLLLRYPGEVGSLENALSIATHVIRRSWKRPGANEEDQGQFLRELAAELDASGMLHLRFLIVGGEPIAYLFEIDYRGSIHPFHSAYSLEFQRFDPGILLLSDGLRDAHDRSCKRYDFTGVGDYLGRWTDTTRSFERIWIVKNSRLSRFKYILYSLEHGRRRTEALRRTEEMKNERKKEGRLLTKREDQAP